MYRRSILDLSAVAALTLVTLLGGSVAQQQSLKDQLVGSWIFVGSTGKSADGRPTWESNPKGQLIFEANGQYSSMIMRSDIPKYASNIRVRGTTDENRAAVHGVIATYGTYTVNEADRSYTIQVEASSFPNWNGSKQKRTINSLTADELITNNPAPSYGGPATELTYKRAK